jgi:hypothetical protein
VSRGHCKEAKPELVSFPPDQKTASHIRAVSKEEESTRVEERGTDVGGYESFLGEACEVMLASLPIAGTKVVIPLPIPHLDRQNTNISHPVPHFIHEGSSSLQAVADRHTPDFSHGRGRTGI